MEPVAQTEERLPCWRRWLPHGPSIFLLSSLIILPWMMVGGLSNQTELSTAWQRFLEAKNPEVDFPWTMAVHLGLWVSATICLVVGITALLTMRRWFQPAPPPDNRQSLPAVGGWKYHGWIWAAMLAALLLRLPLAQGSMWWDEMWNVKFATVGEWRAHRGGEERLRFHRTGWDRALWYYNKPTNHPVQTLPGKAAHELWRIITHAPAGQFSEWVLRLPVLGAGILTIGMVAGLTRRWAGNRAAAIAAWIIALHPWLLRYGVDARSYGMTVFILTGTVWALWKAVGVPGGGSMRWWWLFALGLCLLMWAHVLAHATVCVGLCGAAVLLVWQMNAKRLRWLLMARLAMVTAVAAALFFLLFLPCLLQAMRWHERNGDGHVLTPNYLKKTLWQIAFGQDSETGITLDWQGIPWVNSGIGWLFFVLCSVGVLWGWFILRRRNPPAATMLAGAIIGYTLFMIGVWAANFYFFHRFVIGLAPLLAIFAAVAASQLRWMALPIGIAWIILIAPQWYCLTTRSYSPMRETADLLRAAQEESGGKAILASYGLGSNLLQSYLPEIIDIRRRSGNTLPQLMEEAHAGRKPLYVAWAYDDFHANHYNAGLVLLKNPALFEPVAAFPGIEPDFYHRIVRLRRSGP